MMGKLKISRDFFIFWLGQLASQLGSSMTGFAISIWAYTKTGSVLVLSMSGIAAMLPNMIGGVLAGPIVERLNKKTVLILTDIGAGLCTFILFILILTNHLQIWHIYCINIVKGLFASFQSPASDVAVSLIVPKERYVRASGMQSFAGGAVQALSPAFAAVLLQFTGITGVIFFDFVSLLFACVSLLAFVKIPHSSETEQKGFSAAAYFADMAEGFRVLRGLKLLMTMLLFLALINFFAGLTYYNLLTPIILARTSNDQNALAVINMALGIGGIIGGVCVSLAPSPKRKTQIVFLCAALSFMFGDIGLAAGNSLVVWAAAVFLSSIVLPFLNANESYLWRTSIPVRLQGRAFSFKYALQSGMIPIGILAGGFLADYVFEPFMLGSANVFTRITGNTKGSGMALMFLLTGITGMAISLAGLLSRRLAQYEENIEVSSDETITNKQGGNNDSKA